MADEEKAPAPPSDADVAGVAEVPASGLGLLNRARSKASALTTQAATTAVRVKDHAAGKANELKDASLSLLSSTLDDFNAALPVIREAGYTLSNVDIGIGIPPKISAGFTATDEVSAENIERLLIEHADKKFTVMLMKSLYQAWQLQMKIKIVGLKPKGLSVEIGLVPSVSVRFA